jgi:hypothetical protein
MEQMTVAGNDVADPAGDGTFEDAVVVGIVFDDA